MKKTCLSILLFILIASLECPVSATLPSAKGLPKATEEAQVVVIAKIINQKFNLPNANDPNRGIFQIYPSGLYTLQLLLVVKGQLPSKFQVRLPEISTTSYGENIFTVAKDDRVLLILKYDADGSLVPVNNLLPLIKLATNQTFNSNQHTSTLLYLTSILLKSLSDPSVRLANLNAMRGVVDPQVVVGLIPYLNDPNMNVRGVVFECLATNQQVVVIPRLVELAMQMEKRNRGMGDHVLIALREFKTTDAVPYLNPLTFSDNLYLRTQAVYAIYKIANNTSIPFLILALHDPDPTGNIPAAATIAMHRLVPALGPVPLQSHDDYIKLKQSQTERIYQWWADELNRKHLTKEERTALTAQAEVPQKTEEIQLALYNPSVEVRHRAINALMITADQSSIPYLVLALQDPDATVSYNAYKTLHRLLSLPGEVSKIADYESHRDQEDQPLYDWWANHLKEAPVKIPDSTGFVPLIQH